MSKRAEERLAALMDIDDGDGVERLAAPPDLIGKIVADIEESLPQLDLNESALTGGEADRVGGEVIALPGAERARATGEGRIARNRIAWSRIAATVAVLVLGGYLAAQLWLERFELAAPPPPTSTAAETEFVAITLIPGRGPVAPGDGQTLPSVPAPQPLPEPPSPSPSTVTPSTAASAPTPAVVPPPAVKPATEPFPARRRFLPAPPTAPIPTAPIPTAPIPTAPAPPMSFDQAPAPPAKSLRTLAETITVSHEAPVAGSASLSSMRPLRPPSTGGTHEPNDAPFGDVFFRHSGVNPFVDTEDDAQSTFGLDVDTASWSVVRGYLDSGHLPPPEAARLEEMVNYFDYGLPAPTERDFAVHLHGGETPFTSGQPGRYRLLRVGLRARTVDAAERKPAVLTFVVDVSGSMRGANRLGLVKRSLRLLLDQLQPRDRVALVVYGSRGEVLLEPTEDKERIRTAIDRLQTGGSTNAAEGLHLAYQLAARHFREGGINRVILCSDGVANVGPSGPDSILRLIGASALNGIELTTVGFGLGNYNDILMEQLADRGDGRYAYVDSLREAKRLFVEQLGGTLETVAAEAKVQVEFDPDAVERYRLLGYENRDIADRDFRNDRVDAGEIGAGHAVTALYEIKLSPDSDSDRLGEVRLRYRPADQQQVVEWSEPILRRHVVRSWWQMEASTRLAVLVAEFAEILRQSYWAKDSSFGDLLEQLDELTEAEPVLGDDRHVAELRDLVRRAARLEQESGAGSE